MTPDPKRVASVGGKTPEAQYRTLVGYYGNDQRSWQLLAQNKRLSPALRELIKTRHLH